MKIRACSAGMMVGRLDDAGAHADMYQQQDLQLTLHNAGQPGHWAERVYGNDQPPGIHPSAIPQAGDSLGLVPQHMQEGPAAGTQPPASSQHTGERLEPVLQRFEDVLQGLTSSADLRKQSEEGTAKDTQRLEERLGTIETQLDQLQGEPSHHAEISLLSIYFWANGPAFASHASGMPCNEPNSALQPEFHMSVLHAPGLKASPNDSVLVGTSQVMPVAISAI